MDKCGAIDPKYTPSVDDKPLDKNASATQAIDNLDNDLKHKMVEAMAADRVVPLKIHTPNS